MPDKSDTGMINVSFKTASGILVVVEAKLGNSLRNTAIEHDVEGIVGECGGSMMCATCHVYVAEPWIDALPEPSDGENEMLDCTAAERRTNSRLACQIEIRPELEGLVVHTPETQQKTDLRRAV